MLIIGWIFLLVAIMINYIANVLSLTTWYEFLQGVSIGFLDTVYLFLLYPFLFGLILFYLKDFFNDL